MLLTYLIVLSLLSYSILVIIFIYYIKKANNRHSTAGHQTDCMPITILVCFKDEAQRIAPLLDSFEKLNYPKESLYFLFCDDYSTDSGYLLIEKFLKNRKGRILRRNDGLQGKKWAQIHGVQHAPTPILLQTDADCRVPKDWVQVHIQAYWQQPLVLAVFGVVKIVSSKKTIFSKWQKLEGFALAASSYATWSMGMPTMCSGANMSFRKDIFLETLSHRTDLEIPSGDDVYFMQVLSQKYGSKALLFELDAASVVETAASPNWKSFWKQRKRWAGKWAAGQYLAVRLLAILIFWVNFATVLAIIAWIWIEYSYPEAIILLLISLALRWLLEGFLIFVVSKKMKESFSCLALLSLFFVYPLYVMFTALGSLGANITKKDW